MSKKNKAQAADGAALVAYNTQLVGSSAFRANHKIRSKTLAGFLAILFGSLGVHNFYLGHIVRGILQLVFTLLLLLVCTKVFFFPYIVVLPIAYTCIRGILILTQSDKTFEEKNSLRTL